MTRKYILTRNLHEKIVSAAFLNRGYTIDEAMSWEKICWSASWHGIKSHNALKALDLDTKFGSKLGGCVPSASVQVIESRFKATEVWNANKKCGPAVAYQAIERCIELADEYGTGTVSVDNAFHYLWGGGYVLEAANRGYIGYSACTALLAEVVPYKGRTPTLGTNPHSWSFPTTEAIGFPFLVDWATSIVAMGKIQAAKREGALMPMKCGVDEQGHPSDNPESIVALLPFGEHKGYGLGLLDELLAAFIGGSHPSRRGRYCGDNHKRSTCFFFQVTHPDALNCRHFENERSVTENVREIIEDILGNGNENCLLPGQLEAIAARKSLEMGGIILSKNEINAFTEIANTCNLDKLKLTELEICEK